MIHALIEVFSATKKSILSSRNIVRNALVYSHSQPAEGVFDERSIHPQGATTLFEELPHQASKNSLAAPACEETINCTVRSHIWVIVKGLQKT